MKKIILLIIITAVYSCDGRNQNKKESSMYKHTNRLINESSPYLQQHAHNPVDWYPWGEEAFRKARAENKPILLSIGYAACHWCHVMEEESFENEETAALMNELFVNIKVDREERPDVDQLYMRYVQLMTGSGGWPMTVFLTPDLKPFYGGTYFPPEDRYGRPGFKRLLRLISDYYRNKKDELLQNQTKLDEAIHQSLQEVNGTDLPAKDAFDRACEQLAQMYEPHYGGLGKAPKFPAVQALNLFLRKYNKDGEKRYLDMVMHTLKNMGQGGIYDQLGGGFARYSTDDAWLVPHFEKMLYDNAQLVQLYLDAYLITKETFFLRIVKETLAFAAREMSDPAGGFYSSFDADSEGEEGKFYVWDKNEVIQLLGPEDGAVFCTYYGISEQGNFEGKNILHITAEPRELADRFGKSEDQIRRIVQEGKNRLFRARQKRTPPALDDKVLLSWNALMLSAYARAFQVLRDADYERTIQRHLSFIRQNMTDGEGLFHVYKNGKAKQAAFLDDYAYLIQALLDSYEALFDPSWLKWAVALTRHVNNRFWDEQKDGYFYTSGKNEYLPYRLKDEYDQSVPSATGIMLLNMLRLYSATENPDFIEKAETLLKKYAPAFNQNPYGYASYLNALDFYLSKPDEILLVTESSSVPDSFCKVIFGGYHPNKVVLLKDASQSSSPIQASVFKGRAMVNNQPTAYVCRNFVCSLPVTTAKALQALLERSKADDILPY